MSSLRILRRKIKTITSIQQITNAMKLVSSIRLKNVRNRFEISNNYYNTLKDLTGRIYVGLKIIFENRRDKVIFHPLMEKHKDGKKILIVVSSDKGLCGAFNSLIVEKTISFMTQNSNTELIVVGAKVYKKFLEYSYPILHEYLNIISNFKYTYAEMICKEIIDLYLEKNYSEVYILYSHFKSIIQHPIIIERILPVTPENFSFISDDKIYLAEPGYQEIFLEILPEFLKAKLYNCILDSIVAENAARLTAMDLASHNAQEVIDELSLQLNKARQEKITAEITELLAGEVFLGS